MLVASTGFAQDFDYSFKETYKVSTPARLSISSSDGDIEVMPGTGNEMEVFFVAKQNGRVLNISRAELEDEVTITIVKTNSSLEISVKHPSSNWTIDWRSRINVGFVVYTPRETSCDLHSSDGDVKLRGLAGSQKLKTSDGNIDVIDVAGDLSGVTSDGDIRGRGIRGKVYSRTSDGDIRLSEVTGSVESTTSDGDIRLTDINGSVRTTTSDGNIELANVKGDHSAHTSDGDIYFRDLSGSLEAVASDGNIRGNFVVLKDRLRAKTSDGNIEITVPDRLGMNLYVKGESLNVPLNNFSGRSSKDIIDGTTNGGGVDVNLSTSDGRVTLVYR